MANTLWPRWYKPAIYANNPAWMVIESVARDYGLTAADLRGPSRDQEIVDARRVVTRALRIRGLSYSVIGRVMGGRDHTTVINLDRTYTYNVRQRPYMADCLLRVMEGAA